MTVKAGFCIERGESGGQSRVQLRTKLVAKWLHLDATAATWRLHEKKPAADFVAGFHGIYGGLGRNRTTDTRIFNPSEASPVVRL